MGVELSPLAAEAVLARYGMKIDEDHLLLSNSSNELRELMSGTTFATDWRGILLRVPGTDRNENKTVRINGIMCKVIRIDLKPLFADQQPIAAQQMQFEDGPPAY
jgi:hypothetical protein